MAENTIVVAALLAVLVAAAWQGAVAQSSSCTNALISMSPCLNYITGNSSTPSSSCCSQLASVVQSQPRCLCEVLNGGSSSLGINVNQTQALALPTSCMSKHLQLATAAYNYVGSSSGDSPSSTPTTPSGGNRSTTVPTPDGNSSSNANSTKFASSLLFFFLFIASCASSSLAI
ncbi:hypothetical protein UlMin_031454 [Ulmus minor]